MKLSIIHYEINLHRPRTVAKHSTPTKVDGPYLFMFNVHLMFAIQREKNILIMTHLLEKCPMEKQTNKAGGKWLNKKHMDH